MATSNEKSVLIWFVVLTIIIIMGISKACDNTPDQKSESEITKERNERRYNYTGDDIARELDRLGKAR